MMTMDEFYTFNLNKILRVTDLIKQSSKRSAASATLLGLSRALLISGMQIISFVWFYGCNCGLAYLNSQRVTWPFRSLVHYACMEQSFSCYARGQCLCYQKQSKLFLFSHSYHTLSTCTDYWHCKAPYK